MVILYCTVLYFTLLYCTVLYFTLLYCTSLTGLFPSNHPFSFTVQMVPLAERASVPAVNQPHYKKPILRRSGVTTTAPAVVHGDRMMKVQGYALEMEAKWRRRRRGGSAEKKDMIRCEEEGGGG